MMTYTDNDPLTKGVLAGLRQGLEKRRWLEGRNLHVDYRLGVKTGIDLIKEAKQLESDAPFILLTGKGDIHIDEEAMKFGAFDYLIKSELSSEKLERSIRYSINRATMPS